MVGDSKDATTGAFSGSTMKARWGEQGKWARGGQNKGCAG